MSSSSSATDAEYKQRLSAEQYRVARQGGTERAFSNKFYKHKETGTYVCVCCSQPLFQSSEKYDSGSGWPSFTSPADQTSVAEVRDHSLGMTRVEVKCSRCDAHLGHVFTDGPRESTGLRYCINSASLDFHKQQ